MEKEKKKLNIFSTLKSIFFDDDSIEELNAEEEKELGVLQATTHIEAYESALAFEAEKEAINQRRENKEEHVEKKPNMNINKENKNNIEKQKAIAKSQNNAKHMKQEEDRER